MDTFITRRYWRISPRPIKLDSVVRIDGLTIDEIDAIFRVHRAAAARGVVKIRDDLVTRTRGLVANASGVDTAEPASFLRLAQSQLDVSVIRHLAPPPRKR